MIDVSADGLAAAVANMLSLDPPPSEADIDHALGPMAAAYKVSAEIALEARHLLHSRFNIRMDLGETLLGTDEHTPWLDKRRGAIDPYYWSRYRQLLIRSGWSPLVVATLDRATDDLLDLLGNPTSEVEWRRRGLVLGDVQSGKTASYAALICKAADAGYRMIILLTGTLENVRRQTQERLDAAFVGFDSRDYLDSAKARRTRHIGVGLIDKRRDGVVFTSRERDFRKSAANALNLSLQSLNEPVLVVTKKNKGVLNRLSSWLRVHNVVDQRGQIDLPLLVIDDEADNASINTRSNPGETTAINRSIRDLLGLFRRSSYVGFTATPFANIFIDPSSTDEMLGDDLFPRDFIHVLEPPTNYVGMNKLFPTDDPDEALPSTPDQDSIIRTIDDADHWLPADHKKEAEPEGLPDSLRAALRCFLLTCTVRDLRASTGQEGRGGGIHRSMLVNVSRFTAVQNRVASALHLALEDVRRAIRLYGKLPPASAESQSDDIAAMARTFADEFSSCGFAWSTVLPTMNDAIGPIRVQAVNQGTGAASLDYGVTDQPPGVRVIAVGGNSLSRGLTLEGLSTSYFLRNAKAYDTLLQMGRWFGYRDGYEGLCRLWLTDEAEGWYCHVTEATAELKREFLRMKRRKATPREFGLRVRTHPDTLIITARNKMATGVDVVGERDISLMGRMIESSRLYSDGSRNAENLQILERFLGALRTSYGDPVASPYAGANLWYSVPATAVADLLETFLVHPFNFDFQGDGIAAFLRAAAADGDPLLSSCSVAILTGGKGGAVSIASLPNLKMDAKLRYVKVSRDNGSLLVSGKGARVGSRPDVRHGLPVEVAERIAETWRRNNPERPQVPEDAYRAQMQAPLVLVYLLRGQERITKQDGTETRAFKDGLVLPALGLHFPGTRDPDAPKRLVRYRLNRIAQAELLPPDIEEDTADDDGDPDD
jgi:Z1 domain